jgi:hypothetical protein
MAVALRRKDGVKVPHLVSAVLIELGSEQCVVSIAHDITAIKQTQRELTKAHPGQADRGFRGSRPGIREGFRPSD